MILEAAIAGLSIISLAIASLLLETIASPARNEPAGILAKPDDPAGVESPTP